MKIAYDLGRTIVSRQNNYKPFDNCFEVINKLTKKYGDGYIVSRVNSDQKIRAEKWLEDNDFYNLTGLKKENIYYCFERRDKSIFAAGLNINCFIDDRPDVLIPMNNDIKKICYNPWKSDLIKYKDQIKENNMIIVKNWKEIEEILL